VLKYIHKPVAVSVCGTATERYLLKFLQDYYCADILKLSSKLRRQQRIVDVRALIDAQMEARGKNSKHMKNVS